MDLERIYHIDMRSFYLIDLSKKLKKNCTPPRLC